MYLMKAFMNTLDEMISRGEIDRTIKCLHKKNVFDKRSWFERMKQIRRIKRFAKLYEINKTKYHDIPHWIPALIGMPEDVIKDVLVIMAIEYTCEKYGEMELGVEDDQRGIKRKD